MKKTLSLLFVAVLAFVATSSFAATPTAAPVPTSIKFEVNPETLANHYGETMLVVDRVLNGVRFSTPTQVAPDQASGMPAKRLPDADGDIVFGRPNRVAPGQVSNTPVKGASPVTFQVLVPDCNKNQIADGPPMVQYFPQSAQVTYVTTCPDGIEGVCTFQYWKDPVFGTYWLGIQDAQKDARGQLLYDVDVICTPWEEVTPACHLALDVVQDCDRDQIADGPMRSGVCIRETVVVIRHSQDDYGESLSAFFYYKDDAGNLWTSIKNVEKDCLGNPVIDTDVSGCPTNQ